MSRKIKSIGKNCINMFVKIIKWKKFRNECVYKIISQKKFLAKNSNFLSPISLQPEGVTYDTLNLDYMISQK